MNGGWVINKEDGLLIKLVRNTKNSFVLRVLNMFLGFISSIVVARLLGVEEFGIYTYVLSWMVLTSVVAKMGLPELAVREVARASDNEPLITQFLRLSCTVIVLISLAILSLYGIFVLYIQEGILSYMLSCILVGTLIIPFFSMSSLLSGALRALHKIFQSQFPDFIIRPIIFLFCMVLAGQYMGDGLDAKMSLLLYLLVSVIVFFVYLYPLKRYIALTLNIYEFEGRNKNWMKGGVKFLLMGGALVIISQTDRIMLGLLGDIGDVGVYSVAFLIASFAGFPIVALSMSLAPIVVDLTETGDYLRLESIVLKSTKLAFWGAVIIAVVLASASKTILSLYGDGFAHAEVVLLMHLVGQLLFVAMGPAAIIMNMIGMEMEVTYVVAISAVVNVLLNYTLIPMYGMEGAAMATILSVALWSGSLMIILYTKKKFVCSPSLSLLLSRRV